jgi:hypothetical protein
MGITSNFKAKKTREAKPIVTKPTNPDRLHMTYAQAVAENALITKARQAAKRVEEEVLKGGVLTEVPHENVEVVVPKENPMVKRAYRKKADKEA